MLKQERGIALVSALIILIVISIIALTVGQSSIRNLQLGSARADQQKGQAIATSAMNKADSDFRNAIVYAPAKLTAGNPDAIVVSMDSSGWWLSDSNWSRTGVQSFSTLDSSAGGEPRYRMEYREKVTLNSNLEEKLSRALYRTTARGNGPGSSRTIMQAYFIYNYVD